MLTTCITAMALELPGTMIAAQEDSWSVRLTPYAFLAGLQGTVGVGGTSTDVDASTGDSFEHFNFGVMFTIEARKERWGLHADVLYSDVGADGDVAAPSSSGDEFNFDANTLVLEPQLTYRLTSPGPGWVDLTAGIRYWYMSNGLVLTDGETTVAASESDQHWVDPIVGMQAEAAFDGGWLGMLRGDLGTFEVGAKFTWQASAALGYGFGRHHRYALLAGYRYLAVDYQNDADGFQYNVAMHGPIVGFRVAW